MPSCYAASTYAASGLWQSCTKIKYRPNPKSGKSFDRYAAYEKASTLEESLQLGSKPEDLLFDYEKGHLEVLGPLRKTRLDPFKMKPKDFESLTDADRILIRYGCRHDPSMKKGSGERIQDLDKNLKDLNKKGSQLRKLMVANKLGLDSTEELEGRVDGVAYMQRSMAELEAKEVLAQVAKENRTISEVEVTRVLDLWGFARNPNRINVMQEGQTWVHSDTVGAIARRDGLILPTPPTMKYPHFMKVMAAYMHDNLPPELKDTFVYTSININKDYAGARHRDQGNSGPSFLKALGDFKGGQLQYFPGDDKSKKLEELKVGDSLKVDIKNGFCFFDGNRAHQVEAFEGHRYSLVYFSCARFWKMPPAEQKALKELGILYPSQASIETLKDSLEPPARCGDKKTTGRSAAMKTAERKGAKAKRAKLPGYGYWPFTKQQKDLEAKAQKFYKKKPLRELPKDLQRKRKLEDGWYPGNTFDLGDTVLAKLKAVEFTGAKNLVDACDIFNKDPKKVPKAISKAGYFVLYTIRTKTHKVVYLDGKKEDALKAAGQV